MDYDILKLHHPFSMLVAGRRGAGKSETTLILETLHHNESSRENCLVLGRHQPDLFCSLTQEIPSIEFYEGLPTNIEVKFDRSK